MQKIMSKPKMMLRDYFSHSSDDDVMRKKVPNFLIAPFRTNVG